MAGTHFIVDDRLLLGAILTGFGEPHPHINRRGARISVTCTKVVPFLVETEQGILGILAKENRFQSLGIPGGEVQEGFAAAAVIKRWVGICNPKAVSLVPG